MVVLPTPAELRLLQTLWRIGEGTIDDIVKASGGKPPPNYKTVQTLLRIMERKEQVDHKQQGRAFLFRPRVGRCAISGADRKHQPYWRTPRLRSGAAVSPRTL